MLVEFGETIADAIHDEVVAFHAALAESPFRGFVEAVPAYASVLVYFDVLVTDHKAAREHLSILLSGRESQLRNVTSRVVDVCYDAEFAPDLPLIASSAGVSDEAVVQAHLAGDYKVFMYGFAPGYAYLAGVPETIRRPRKDVAVRGIPTGSVLIAGEQCLVSTLTMPTGWWIIGRSPTRILNSGNEARPFLFDVGDSVKFRRISRAEFEAGGHP
jgi:inhibitor of KinA